MSNAKSFCSPLPQLTEKLTVLDRSHRIHTSDKKERNSFYIPCTSTARDLVVSLRTELWHMFRKNNQKILYFQMPSQQNPFIPKI